MIRVRILQCDDVFVFSPSEFFYYLVGLCDAGRNPLLHITSTLSKSSDCNSLGGYEVLIEFSN